MRRIRRSLSKQLTAAAAAVVLTATVMHSASVGRAIHRH